jgi:hypothetical protein
MNRLFLVAALALLALAVAVPTPAALAAKKKKATPPVLVYVNDGGEFVYGFTLNSDNTLTELDDSPFETTAGPDNNATGASSCTNNCETIAFSQDRNLLFVGHSNGLDVFNVASDGSLSLVPGSPFLENTEIVGVAELPSNKQIFVYAAEPDNPGLVHIFKTESNGSLTEFDSKKSPVEVGDTPFGMTIADGMLFVANSGDDTVSGFKIGGGGTLDEGPRSPFDFSEDIQAVFSQQEGRKRGVVNVGETGHEDISVFNASKKRNPILKAVENSPFGTDLNNTAGGAVLGGDLVVGIDTDDHQVQVFKSDKKNRLQALGGVQDTELDSGAEVGLLTHGGGVLILVDSDNHKVASYTVNSSTGAIDQADKITTKVPFTDGANGIVVTKP